VQYNIKISLNIAFSSCPAHVTGELHHFNCGSLLMVWLRVQLAWIQGSFIYDPGLSFLASEGRVTGFSAVMENNTLSHMVV
jgi:hypothetical protein